MERGRARDLGVVIGTYPTGARNAITDVDGVRVGHATVVRDPSPSDGRGAVRTGVTAVFPHEGLPWVERVYAGTHVLNGYGEMIGINQIDEWGLLHSPIVMTSSLAIGKAYDATIRWRAERYATTTHEGGDMPVVTECDDSFLNDVTTFPLADADVSAALDAAVSGDVAEGCVGAGTGMQCMDFKGGIGTASRLVPGGWTIGILTLTNFGERQHLRIDGVPVGREITDLMPSEHREGSCIVVVATDAPMLPHQVRRLAVRAGLGLARCGSTAHNGSGELMIAFSTANRIPLDSPDGTVPVRAILDGPGRDSPDVYSDLFAATVEAVEESVVNALFVAETTSGRDGNVYHALPIDRTLEILTRYGRGPR
ncbi:MAG TPA: P1 family peptidase [Actinomycetota bacterium]|nr:P1 family peptidase [Actinomycetota bacterium]